MSVYFTYQVNQYQSRDTESSYMTTKAFYWELRASQTGNQLHIREDERLAIVRIILHHGEFTAGTKPQQLVELVSLRGEWD